MLALIEAALEGRVPRGLESTTIDGQQITRIPIVQLHSLRQKYRAERLNETALTTGRSRTIGIRFVRPS